MMKKKDKCILLSLVSLFFLCSFCDRLPEVVTLQGHIQSFGNVPFNYYGFVTGDGRQYKIKIDDKKMAKHIPEDAVKVNSMKQLSALFGEHLECTGYIEEKSDKFVPDNQLKDGVFVVWSYRIIGS